MLVHWFPVIYFFHFQWINFFLPQCSQKIWNTIINLMKPGHLTYIEPLQQLRREIPVWTAKNASAEPCLASNLCSKNASLISWTRCNRWRHSPGRSSILFYSLPWVVNVWTQCIFFYSLCELSWRNFSNYMPLRVVLTSSAFVSSIMLKILLQQVSRESPQ